MPPPTIAVIIPAFNAEHLLGDTLESVLRQTRPPDDTLVVDDGSTDRTVVVAKAFGPRVRVISQPNRGESAARNVGLARTSSDWVAWLDADDLWTPGKLARQLECLRQADSGVVCVFTGIQRFGPGADGPLDGRIELPDRARFTPGEHILHWRVHPSTALVRRDRSPRFPEWTQHAEDVLYFAELAAAGPFAAVREPLVRVRSSPGQQTKSAAHLVGSHASRSRWALSSGLVPGDELQPILDRLDEDLLEQMANKKWRRDWRMYWVIRRYLAETRPALRERREIQERIAPPWAYRLKDRVDSLLRARRPAHDGPPEAATNGLATAPRDHAMRNT